jgi:two-component system cell cycle response regulator
MSRRPVLVVDDSDLTRAVLRRYLARAGYQVVEARDGAEAAVEALKGRPTVVVTDLEMPVMDGYQLARLLKNDPGTAHVPVIILTSHREATSRFWGEHAGADAFLTKDELADELIPTVNRLADMASQTPEIPENPPSSSLEVLALVARHLDEGLMDLTLINQVQQVGIENASFGAAACSLLDLFNQVVDAELLGICVFDNRGLSVHLRRPVSSTSMIDVDSLATFVSRTMDLGERQIAVLRLDGKVIEEGQPLEVETGMGFNLALRDAHGCLVVWPRQQEILEGLPLELLTKAAPHAALVLDNVRLAEHLWEMSTHDGLTRLLNHRSILERIGEEMERSIRYKTPMSALLCDIDRFKAVNDTFGHVTGDLILKEFAVRLKNGLRSCDVIGRYGGEEFLAILPCTDIEAAGSVARRICSSLIEEPMEIEAVDNPVKVTASFGIACSAELSGRRRTQEIVSLADSRLYEAKEAGRACVKP